jgi:hypothetical protein
MADSGTYTPETIARRLKIAESLLGEPKQPIRHWAEGLNELAKGYFGGKLYADAEKAEKDNATAQTDALKRFLGGGSPTSSVAQPAAAATPMSDGNINVPEQYRPIIAQASKQYGIPENVLARQIQAESNFNPQVVSSAGAQGISQFMPATAKEMGVDPMNPASAIPGGAQYLAQNRDRYGGDITKALAAYNWGPGNVDKWVAGGADPARLPNETRNYIGRILGPQALGGAQVAQAQTSMPAAGGDTKAAIVNMLNSPNPSVQRMGRTLATGIIQKQLEGEKPTDDMRELSAINAERKARGEAPMGLYDYQRGLKEAGKPVTNINQQQESEYQKATGKQLADANMEIIKSAGNARGKIATLNRLGTLLQNPSVYQGKAAESMLELKRLGKAIGVDVGDVGPGEAVKSISNQFALELRNPAGGAGMPGAMSDKDREFLQSMVPGLGQNPQGNALIIDYMKRVAQRSVDVEKLRQQYVRKHGRLDEGFYTALADWSDANPLFTDDDMQKAAVPTAPAGNRSIDDLLRQYGTQK